MKIEYNREKILKISVISGKILLSLMVVTMAIMLYVQNNKISALSENLKTSEENINKAKFVYTFNMEELVLLYPDLVNKKKEFDNQIAQLSNEVDDAQNKIKNIKKAKIKEDLSSMYLKSLTTKRDETIATYQKSMQDMTNKINAVLLDLCKQNNITTVFDSKVITVSSSYVIDLTPEVAKRLQK